MKLCDSCSTQLPDDASVCSQCGMVLPDEEDMTIRRLPISPDDLLSGNIAIATDEEDVTIQGWPIPMTSEDAANKGPLLPNPETPIPDMAVLDRLLDEQAAIALQNTPMQDDSENSAALITGDPTPAPLTTSESDTIDDDPAPALPIADDGEIITDDPTPVLPDAQDVDSITDDPVPVLPVFDAADSITDDPTPIMAGTRNEEIITDDPTPVLPGTQDDTLADDPTPVSFAGHNESSTLDDDPTPGVVATQEDAEVIRADSAPLFENTADAAIILADAPGIETEPHVLAATLEALEALTAHDDPTPANRHFAETQGKDVTPPDLFLDGTGEETTSKNGGYTAPVPLYPDYGKAKATSAPQYSQPTGGITDGQATLTAPTPLYDKYQSATIPAVTRGSTASLMRLPQKIYTAYPQLLSRSGLISLTLCLLLIISSIGLIIVRRPQAGNGGHMYPIAAKLVLSTPTVNAEVIKGTPAIQAVHFGNSGKQPLHWLATSKDTPWLSLSRQSGTINVKEPDQTIYAKINTAIMTEGVHNGSIQFQSSGGNASVPISINVLPANAQKLPIISVDPPTLTFDTLAKGQQVTKTLTVSNTGNAPLKWNANTDSPSWLTLNPASGNILPGGYPQPLVLTVNTATLPVGSSSAQLTISSNASKTAQTLGVTINVTPSNGNALTISTNPGSFTSGCLECEVLLTASPNVPGSKSSVNWSTSSVGVSGITFSPSAGTLLAGQSIPVKVTVPNTACPAGAYFNFTGDANNVPVLWSCTPPPSPVAVLTASPTDLTTCTTCTVYISPAAGSQSKLSWKAQSSGINGITISPSSGTVAAGSTMAVTITIPQQNCPAFADITFQGQGPNNATTVAWSCAAPPPLASMLSVNPTSLNSSQCSANGDSTYNCLVTLTESPAGNMGWSSFSNVGGNFSLTTGQFSANTTSVQVSVNDIQCQDGLFGFLGSNNEVTVNWNCMTNPPALTIDTNTISQSSGNCVADATYGYDCTVTLGESFGGTLNWTESDNLGASISQSSGQLTSNNPSQVVTFYYIPCGTNGTITFSAANSTQLVTWTCGQTPQIGSDSNSLSDTSPNCSPNGDGTYFCYLNLSEQSQGTVNWSESDTFGSNSYISQLNGTLTPSNPGVQIVYYNIPCVPSGSITFTSPVNTINVNWTCSQPTQTPPVQSLLYTDQSSLSDSSPNCSPNGDGTYFCYLNLSESPLGPLNWSESDSLGTAVSQSSGTLTPSSSSTQIYFYSLPCSTTGVSDPITLTATNNTVSVNWNCTTPNLPTLTVDNNNIAPNAGNCSPDPSYGYDCVVTLGESFAGPLTWYEYDNLGVYVSSNNGQLAANNPNQAVTLYNIPCQYDTFTFYSSNSTQYVNWSCSAPPPVNLSVNPSSLDTSNCNANGNGTYSCQVSLSEDQSVATNWYANDDNNLGVSFSQNSGTLNGTPQTITINNIPCQYGTFTFYSGSANSATATWNCTPSGPTPTPTPNLSVNPGNLDPSVCNANGDGTYNCQVSLSEDQSVAVNWNANDNGLGVSFSPSNGTLNSTPQTITINNIPCQNDTFSFSGSGANGTSASWSCTPQPSPTPITPNLSVSPSNLDTSNCNSNGDGTYNCQVSLNEDQSVAVNWSANDNNGLGVSFSPSNGTLNGSPQTITINNIPCQNDTFSFSGTGANGTTANWSCTQVTPPPSPTPSPTTVTPNLSVSPNSLDTSNCNSNGDGTYNCQVSLSEDQSVAVNWSASDGGLGVSFSPPGGTLNGTAVVVTINNIPCQNGTFSFIGSGANGTSANWSCSQQPTPTPTQSTPPPSPTPTPTPSPTPSPTQQTANLAVGPGSLNTSNCSSSGNNVYSCTVTLSEDSPVTINWSVNDDNGLGVSFSQSSGTLGPGNTSQSITISNIPCQNGSFTFSGSGANNPASVSWSCS